LYDFTQDSVLTVEYNMCVICSFHQVCVQWQPATDTSANSNGSSSNSSSNNNSDSSSINSTNSVQVMLHIALQASADRADSYKSERYNSGSYRSIMPVLSLPITVHRQQYTAVSQPPILADFHEACDAYLDNVRASNTLYNFAQKLSCYVQAVHHACVHFTCV
jgi:hypothetical protein